MKEGPNVGDKAPRFSLMDVERKRRTLDGFRGKKLVIAFYPGAFTSVCTKEMCTFRDSITRLEEVDSTVVGISVNDPFTLAAFGERNAINFPLLSDYGRRATEEFGVSLENFAGMEGYTAAKRSIFVLDEEGAVRYRWVTEDQGVEPDYGEIQRTLEEMD